MTDYNDGQIHGWNGGECPVHPKSVVEVRSWSGAMLSYPAGSIDWPSIRGCFRVIKAYREPRVFWVNEYKDGRFGDVRPTKEAADKTGADHRIACHRIELP